MFISLIQAGMSRLSPFQKEKDKPPLLVRMRTTLTAAFAIATKAQVRKWLPYVLVGFLAALALLVPLHTYAQVNTGQFQTAVNSIVQAVKAISAIAVALLIVTGLAILMWAGVAESFRVKAVRIIMFCVIGGGTLFLFAEPIAAFLVSTFQAGGTTG